MRLLTKNETYEGYLLRLTEVEVTTRSANALASSHPSCGVSRW